MRKYLELVIQITQCNTIQWCLRIWTLDVHKLRPNLNVPARDMWFWRLLMHDWCRKEGIKSNSTIENIEIYVKKRIKAIESSCITNVNVELGVVSDRRVNGFSHNEGVAPKSKVMECVWSTQDIAEGLRPLYFLKHKDGELQCIYHCQPF